MTTQPKFSIFLSIFISLLALTASIYSVILARESHYINKTQILVGKTNELLMLLTEAEKLSNIEFGHLNRILTILENNQKILDKEKTAYNHYKITINGHFKRQREDFNLWRVLLENIGNKGTKDIYWLESYIGVYKLRISHLIEFNDQAKKDLDVLKEKLRQRPRKS